jgi:predicted dehydrogenase
MTKIAIVGAGWRAHFYIRIAQALSENFEIVGVVARQESARASLNEKYSVATYSNVGALLKHETPDYVVSSVSWDSNPSIINELVSAGIPVLSETPPAPTYEALEKLWKEVGHRDLVQVAEQYLFLPGHAARLALTRAGTIGEVTSVEVSSTHGYHAVSMMRGFLNAGYEPATVNAHAYVAPLIDPLNRDSWNSDLAPKSAKTTVGLIDFGSGKSGIYNFVDNQWHNQLRHRRIVVRGSAGEIVDDHAIRLVDGPAITTSRFERYQLGYDLNLDGYDTEHISFDGKVVFKNPFIGKGFMDEEIAIGQVMVKMADWVSGKGDAPYPLAEACQDHLISLSIEESVKTGQTVITPRSSWAK